MSLERLKKTFGFLGGYRLSAFLRRSLWHQVIALFILSILLVGLAVYIGRAGVHCFYDFYDLRLRGYLFSGFLTTGAFIMSLKSFIIVVMKNNVYDMPWYQRMFKDRRGIKEGDAVDKKELYRPLVRLSEFLHWSIVLSIFTAVSQFSFGLIERPWVAIFCVWIGLFTLLVFMNALRLLRNNILVWLEHE